MTRHGKDCPRMCSQCQGAEPRRVTVIGNELYLDGVALGRQLDHERVITARRTQRRRPK